MKGYTLIEVIIYIAIVSVFLVLSTGFAWDIIQGNFRVNCYREIQQNARFALEVVNRDLKSGKEPSIFSVSNGILHKNGIALTTEKVVVTNFSVSPLADTYNIRLVVRDRNQGFGIWCDDELSLESTVLVAGQLTPDLPALYFSSSEYSTEEGIESITIEVNLDRQSQDIVQVNYSTRDGTAVHPQDYIETKGVLVFDPGDTQETFEVPIVQDSNSEPDEIFQVYLENPVNAILGTPNVSTVTILDDDGSLNCWGIGGSCDPDCQYSDFGVLTSYYRDPGCSERCQSVGNIYTNYTFSCSTDGTGNCYRMNSSQREPTSCTQSNSCEGICEGECVPCREIINEEQCTQQQGCFWFFSRCFGRCTPCQDLQEEQACKNQLKCEWKSTKWFWILGDYQSGYSSYTTCQWYE